MFKYEKFSASNTVQAPAVERVVEFSPPGVDAENIAKVLSLAVDGKVISAEAGDGFADVVGRANFKLLYLDREGVPKGVDYNADFSLKVEGNFAPDDTLSAEVAIAEADVVTGDSITLSAVVEVRASAAKRHEIEALADAEQCYKSTAKLNLPAFVAAKALSVPVEDEIEAGDVENVLLIDSAALVTSASVENGIVKVEVKTAATVTYSENGEIKFADFEIPISEEVVVEGAEDGDLVNAEASFRNARIVLAGVTGANILRFEGDVAVKIQVVRCRETEVVADMFMLTNEITLIRSDAEFTYFGGMNYRSEKVAGTALLGDNRAAARDIVAIPYSRCYIAKAVVVEGGASVEGIVTADIVYRDENGFNSVRTEVPFSLEIPGEFEGELRAGCMVESVYAKVRRDREIEVEARIGLLISEYVGCAAAFISSVEVGEEKEQNTSALSLYIASEGDEMWDVCKALTATPEAILEQNPALATPLSEGERVVFFRTLTM